MSIMSAKANRNPAGEKNDNGPLRSLFADDVKNAIKFPENIESIGPYMSIGAYKTHFFPAATKQSRQTKEQKEIEKKVYLPMPSGLSASYQQQYNSDAALGPIGVALGRVAADPVNQGRMKAIGQAGMEGKVGDAASMGTSLAADMIEQTGKEIGAGGVMSVGVGVAEELASVAGAAVGGVAGAAVGEGLRQGVVAAQGFMGLARNPHMAVLYNNPAFRGFNFAWELRPKNPYETDQIAKILDFFKFYSAPAFENGNHFFKYPNQFKLKFRHPEYLFAFGDCVLTNFSVDYHGEGTPLYYDKTSNPSRKLLAPAVVKITTEWLETSIVTKKSVEKDGR